MDRDGWADADAATRAETVDPSAADREPVWQALKHSLDETTEVEAAEVRTRLIALRDAPDSECERAAEQFDELGRRMLRPRTLKRWAGFLAGLKRTAPARFRHALGLRCAEPARLRAFFDAVSETVPFPRQVVEDYFSSLPDSSFPRVTRAVVSDGCPALPTALVAWGRLVSRREPTLLHDLLSDPNERTALIAISLIPDRGVVAEDLVRNGIDHPAEAVRLAAIRRLRRFPDQRQATILSPLLQDQRDWLVIAAAHALARPRSMVAIRPLVQHCMTKSFLSRPMETRVELWTALAASQRPEALTLVEKALRGDEKTSLGGRIEGLVGKRKLPEWIEPLVQALAALDQDCTWDILKRAKMSKDRPLRKLVESVMAEAGR